ncbi:mechanosensitive ion channel domain-containing protein [Teichococcus rhizosphaerae]|uniref:mechanosensitive ion channel domain-containing protein n=1 Tax=Teichococcus rhizosphaerae TaxID=1335062 RepID=UPI00114574CC|nr:mechanosensitive ion channel domain-containing protein [Pseudoroseomonas rhizosphaerae]
MPGIQRLTGWLGIALLALGLGLPLAAQGQGPAAPATTPATTPAGTPAAAAPAADPVAALDGILATLRNDADRAAFVTQLEQLRASLAARTQAAPNAAAPATPAEAADPPPEAGLLGAVAAGLTDVGQSVREHVEGGTLRQRFAAAGEQLAGRLGTAWEEGDVLRFLLWAGGGWGLAAALLYGLSALPWLRPRRDAERFHPESRADLWRTAGLEAARRLAPLVPATMVIFGWTAMVPGGWQEARLFLAVATPFLLGALVWRLGYPLFFLLGPLRGWQIARYARRRVLPWLVALAALAAASSNLRDAELRWIIGPDAALLAGLAVDAALVVVSVLFVLRRRRAVRRLLVDSRTEAATGKGGTFRAVGRTVADYWHFLALILVAGHVISRLLGLGQGAFLGRALLSIGMILLVITVTFALSGMLARLTEAMQQGRGSLARQLQGRYLALLRQLLRVLATVAVAVLCLRLWNFDILAWISGGIGFAIFRPIASIAVAVLVGWVIWITLDTAVEHALTPSDSAGRPRDHSTRARTLLPMLRNFAFVVLCALTVIAIMSNLGINVAPLLAGAGVVGLAISFGSQQLVQDVITGLFMLIEDTIAIGDTIDTGDRAGTVESVTIRTVRVRDGDGALHTIPFSQIKALKNRSRGFGVYTVKVVVGYDTDLDRAMKIMNEVGEELQNDPALGPNMLGGLAIWGVDQFTPDGITILGGLRTRALQQWSVGRAFNLRLKQRFDREGIALTPPRPSLVMPARGAWPEPEAGPDSGTEARQPA